MLASGGKLARDTARLAILLTLAACGRYEQECAFGEACALPPEPFTVCASGDADTTALSPSCPLFVEDGACLSPSTHAL